MSIFDKNIFDNEKIDSDSYFKDKVKKIINDEGTWTFKVYYKYERWNSYYDKPYSSEECKFVTLKDTWDFFKKNNKLSMYEFEDFSSYNIAEILYNLKKQYKKIITKLIRELFIDDFNFNGVLKVELVNNLFIDILDSYVQFKCIEFKKKNNLFVIDNIGSSFIPSEISINFLSF